MPSILSNSRILLALTGSFILLSFFLGGISMPSRLTDAVLQFASLPLFLYALWHLPSMKWTVSQRRACLLCLCFLLLPLVQLIPIPPSLWMIFPFRNWSGEVFGILNRPFEWMPLSLAPVRTWLSALSLLPPMAVFLALVQMNETLRQKISLLLVGSGCFMAILAILQFSQGPSSVLRVFEYTQQEEAVGFFANRNHLAAFLLGMLVLAAAFVIKNSRPFFAREFGCSGS